MTFYDASTDPELAAEAAVLAEIVRAADAIGVEVLVIGAVARDILIRHVLGARPQRATRDVDVAVVVGELAGRAPGGLQPSDRPRACGLPLPALREAPLHGSGLRGRDA